MHCKDCKFCKESYTLSFKGKLLKWEGFCSIQKRIMKSSDLCKFIERRVK